MEHNISGPNRKSELFIGTLRWAVEILPPGVLRRSKAWVDYMPAFLDSTPLELGNEIVVRFFHPLFPFPLDHPDLASPLGSKPSTTRDIRAAISSVDNKLRENTAVAARSASNPSNANRDPKQRQSRIAIEGT